MSKKAAQVLVQHRQEGAVIFGEPLAVSLVRTGEVYYDKDWQKAAAHVMSPPLSRDPNTPEFLLDLLTR
jgi:dihydropyrimidinase